MQNNPIKILLIEDNLAFVRVLTLFLEEDNTRVWEIKHGMSLKEGIGYLQEASFDIIITDLSFPGTPRNQIIKTLRDVNLTIPIAILSAYSDEDLIEEILNQGAQRFFAKEDILSENFPHEIFNIINGISKVPSAGYIV